MYSNPQLGVCATLKPIRLRPKPITLTSTNLMASVIRCVYVRKPTRSPRGKTRSAFPVVRGERPAAEQSLVADGAIASFASNPLGRPIRGVKDGNKSCEEPLGPSCDYSADPDLRGRRSGDRLA